MRALVSLFWMNPCKLVAVVSPPAAAAVWPEVSMCTSPAVSGAPRRPPTPPPRGAHPLPPMEQICDLTTGTTRTVPGEVSGPHLGEEEHLAGESERGSRSGRSSGEWVNHLDVRNGDYCHSRFLLTAVRKLERFVFSSTCGCFWSHCCSGIHSARCKHDQNIRSEAVFAAENSTVFTITMSACFLTAAGFDSADESCTGAWGLGRVHSVSLLCVCVCDTAAVCCTFQTTRSEKRWVCCRGKITRGAQSPAWCVCELWNES